MQTSFLKMRFLAAVIMIFAAQPSLAQDGVRTERVRFQSGKAGVIIKGSIIGYETVSYLLDARAGQVMRVSLQPSNLATYFNVYQPGRGPGDQALATSDGDGPMVPDINEFNGVLPVTGTYTISVYMFRSAARRNERSRFTLDVGISPRSVATQLPAPRDDYADGMDGGPDFWEVTGVRSGDFLNLRQGPTTGARIVARLGNGTTLRNRGCLMSGGQRWCRVETVNGGIVYGWVAGRFLREGG
jgi:hypothetical protein